MMGLINVPSVGLGEQGPRGLDLTTVGFNHPALELGELRLIQLEGSPREEARRGADAKATKAMETSAASQLSRARTARTKLEAHLAILERGASEQETADMLHRAAVLERAVSVLERRALTVARTIGALAQKEWELDHMIALEAVASPAELEEVKRILARAEELVDERTPPPEQQDVGKLEASLFDRLVKGD